MSDVGVFLIPIDLVLEIADAKGPSGVLIGAAIKEERIVVITSAAIDGETKHSNRSPQLLAHRAFQFDYGSPPVQVAFWAKVSSEAASLLKDSEVVDQGVIEALVGDVKLAEGIHYVCTVEPTNEAPNVRGLLVYCHSGKALIFELKMKFRGTPKPFARLPEDLVKLLEQKRVVIVGVGSGGSAIAVQLASCGVGKLYLFDDERLEQPNIIRHVLTRRDIYRNKVAGLRSELLDRDLPTQVEIFEQDVMRSADSFRRVLKEQKPDLVVCATDSRESRRFVNYCGVRLGIPLVIAGTLDNGKIGEVLSVYPGVSACFECVRLQLHNAFEKPDFEGRPTTPYMQIQADKVVSAALPLDVTVVASLATRVTLQVLDPGRFEHLPTNYLLWGREKTNYSEPFNFSLPLATTYVSVTRVNDCPACGSQSFRELESLDIDGSWNEVLANANALPS